MPIDALRPSFYPGAMGVVFLAVGALGWAPVAFAQEDDPAGQAACAEAASPLEFYAAERAGEKAFGDLDIEGLQAARLAALDALRCLDVAMSDQMAAAFHRLMAIEAFTTGDNDRVKVEFAAARRLQPGYAIKDRVAPEGHPLRTLYDEATDSHQGLPEIIWPPVGGSVMVDGVRGAPRYSGVSCVVQVFDEQGGLVETVYASPGDALPVWGHPPTLQSANLKRPLAVGTGMSLVASAVLYSMAWRQYQTFNDLTLSLDESELENIKFQNNVLVYGSAGAGALAFGLGVGAYQVW